MNQEPIKVAVVSADPFLIQYVRLKAARQDRLVKRFVAAWEELGKENLQEHALRMLVTSTKGLSEAEQQKVYGLVVRHLLKRK